jgi:hypothetical protein
MLSPLNVGILKRYPLQGLVFQPGSILGEKRGSDPVSDTGERILVVYGEHQVTTRRGVIRGCTKVRGSPLNQQQNIFRRQ